MKMFLISDNDDTLVGMRLSGVEGCIVHDKESALAALNEKMSEDDIAIIMLTYKVVELIEDTVYDYKLNRKKPLIIEIPDRHGNGKTENSITRYVEEAIGIKIK